MSNYKLGCFASVAILSSCLVACGGGGSDSSTAGTSSSGSSAVAAPTPIKTVSEAFQDMYGVKPGIYEMTFKGSTTTVVTRSRILANEIAVGTLWGFVPYFEVCNDIDEGVLPDHFGTGMKQGDLPKGQIYYRPVDSNFGEDVILTVDATNPNILVGTRFNETNAEQEDITMRWISGDKDYSEGSVDLTTSISGFETIKSSSVCYSSITEVVDYGEGVLIVEDRLFINVLKKRVFGENAGLSGDRIAGIMISEDSDSGDKKENAFFMVYLKERGFNTELIPHGLVNEKKNVFGQSDGIITYATSADALSFAVDVKGDSGTEAAGFFVKGNIALKPK